MLKKKEGFNVEAHGLLEELKDHLDLGSLKAIRILHR